MGKGFTRDLNSVIDKLALPDKALRPHSVRELLDFWLYVISVMIKAYKAISEFDQGKSVHVNSVFEKCNKSLFAENFMFIQPWMAKTEGTLQRAFSFVNKEFDPYFKVTYSGF
ncbi:hypothetical protein L6452_09392 [Arctium lappa]|uniref:Uncharacterized protein n=1 Tax=Arctium lappa TaxID=4217 RepID=A0ACB9DKK3_ARCLA|nr:hypothetical protein L6452_09392 [Arctium lappa]